MEVLHYRVGPTWHREIIETSYTALQELKSAYQSMGHKARLGMHETIGGLPSKWILTVEMGETR